MFENLTFKQLRLRSGFKTQLDLARVIGCSRSTVSMWELGKAPARKNLDKLIEVFNVDYGTILQSLKNST